MPKGRGSNKQRKKREKDKSESIGKGYLKLFILYEDRHKRIAAREKARASK